MGKYRALYGSALLTALLVTILANRQEPLVLLCFLVILPLLSAALQLVAMHGITFRCQARESCYLSQEVPITFVMERRSRLPLGMVRLRMEFHSLLFNSTQPEVFELQPEDEKNSAFCYRFLAEDCGKYIIRAKQICCYDMLGLFCWRLTPKLEHSLTVYPPELRLQTELTRRPESKNFGEMYDKHRRGHDVSEVFGLREYVDGDPLTSIHWKLSSKMDNLIIREFGRPSNYNTLILYDMVKKVGDTVISNKSNNTVLAIVNALSYSLIELRLGHNVGRVTAGELQSTPILTANSQEQLLTNLLSMPVSEEDPHSIITFLHSNLQEQFTKVIYITPYLQEQVMQEFSSLVDLTVIQIMERGGEYTVAAKGYDIIPIDAGAYQETVHTIII